MFTSTNSRAKYTNSVVSRLANFCLRADGIDHTFAYGVSQSGPVLPRASPRASFRSSAWRDA